MPPDERSLLARAFAVLGVFAPGRSDLTLAELTAGSGLPRSTVHRLLVQLEGLGAVERSALGWRLGVRMFELGQLVPTQQRLRERALPFMNDVYEATHETVHLAVLEGADVVYVEVIAGHRKVSSPSRRGGRVPAHCTGVGKVLLAFGDAPLADPLVRRTPATITDPVAMRRELADVRRVGVAFDREEAQEGLCCVAAPVRDHRGVVAGLSVSMPTGGPMTPEEAAGVLRASAGGLSRLLGAR